MGSEELTVMLEGKTPFMMGPLRMMKNTWKRKNLIRNLISRDFKVTYHGHFLGYLWSLLEPLALTAIFFLVFIILRGSTDTLLPLRIMIGILIFNSFAKTLNSCTNCLVQNSSLIQQVYFPREIFPVAIGGFRFISLCLSMLIIIPYMIYESIAPTGLVFLLPISMICSVLLGQGLGMMASVIQVRLRDLKQVIDLIVRAGFFLSGVFFGAEIIPPEYLQLYFYNPVAVFIEMARAAVIGDLGVLYPSAMVRSVLLSIIIYVFATAVFVRFEKSAVKFL